LGDTCKTNKYSRSVPGWYSPEGFNVIPNADYRHLACFLPLFCPQYKFCYQIEGRLSADSHSDTVQAGSACRYDGRLLITFDQWCIYLRGCCCCSCLYLDHTFMRRRRRQTIPHTRRLSTRDVIAPLSSDAAAVFIYGRRRSPTAADQSSLI